MKRKFLVLILLLIMVSACNRNQEQRKPNNAVIYPGGAAVAVSPEQIGMLRRATEQSPKNAIAWITLGNALMDSSRFSEAADAYQKALALDPKNVNVRVDRGTCLKNSGRPREAVKEFRRAIKINPKHINAHRNLAVVLTYDLHEPEAGAREFEKYLELSPNAPDATEIRQLIETIQSKH